MCVKYEEFGLQIGGILRRFSRPGLAYICTKVAYKTFISFQIGGIGRGYSKISYICDLN